MPKKPKPRPKPKPGYRCMSCAKRKWLRSRQPRTFSRPGGGGHPILARSDGQGPDPGFLQKILQKRKTARHE